MRTVWNCESAVPFARSLNPRGTQEREDHHARRVRHREGDPIFLQPTIPLPSTSAISSAVITGPVGDAIASTHSARLFYPGIAAEACCAAALFGVVPGTDLSGCSKADPTRSPRQRGNSFCRTRSSTLRAIDTLIAFSPAHRHGTRSRRPRVNARAVGV